MWKNGAVSHPLYRLWCNMKQRCYNRNNAGYVHYGGRGIAVCNEWRNDFWVVGQFDLPWRSIALLMNSIATGSVTPSSGLRSGPEIRGWLSYHRFQQ